MKRLAILIALLSVFAIGSTAFAAVPTCCDRNIQGTTLTQADLLP